MSHILERGRESLDCAGMEEMATGRQGNARGFFHRTRRSGFLNFFITWCIEYNVVSKSKI